MEWERSGRRPGKIGCGTWLVGLVLTAGVMALVNAPRPDPGGGAGPPVAAPAAGLPAPDADGHPLRAGDVVMHVNDHGAPTVAVGYRGAFIRVANRTRSTLTGGIRPTQVPGVVFYEAEVAEGEHAGKRVTCAPKALRFAGHGR